MATDPPALEPSDLGRDGVDDLAHLEALAPGLGQDAAGLARLAQIWIRRALAAEAEAAALRLELERHAITCGWRREDDANQGEDVSPRRLHRKLEDLLARALKPGLTPRERANRLSVAWRNWLGTGGWGIGTRMELASHMERVIAAAEQQATDAINAEKFEMRLEAGRLRQRAEKAEAEAATLRARLAELEAEAEERTQEGMDRDLLT